MESHAAAERQYLNIAGYRFLELSDLESLREILLDRARADGLKGTILISHEGVNFSLSGEGDRLDKYFGFMCGAIGTQRDIPLKRSWSEYQPFTRMLVRIKQQIIPMTPNVSPIRKTGKRLPPKELHRWYQEGRDFTILDTRNAYETQLGTFKDAMDPELDHFRNFPEVVKSIDPSLKKKPLVTFCTGAFAAKKRPLL